MVGQLSQMQQAIAHNKEGDGDGVSCSTDTSRWSTPSRQHCRSKSSVYSSEGADSLPDKTPQVKTTEQWQGSNMCGRKKGKKQQGSHMEKTHYVENPQVLKLPPIKPLQDSKPLVLTASLTRELKNQVSDLQQQLSEARTENKLLKRLQYRHTVALQHFQDSEGSLSQILTKHSNEARVLQQLLRETRVCRDSLARQLQTTENKLNSTKAALHHLQLLNQDHSLLEREELTFRLERASAELKDKDKRILDLEKNLELSQASFNRQIVNEQRKITEARKISCYLQEQIYQLNKEIQDREKELETHNIYSRRFLKGFSKKGRESKMVQTDELVLLPVETASRLELEHTDTDEKLENQESSVNWCCYNPEQESLLIENLETEVSANVTLEENDQDVIETCAGLLSSQISEQSGCSEEGQENQTERDCDEEVGKVLKEEWKDEQNEMSYITDDLQVLEECKIDQHESAMSDISENPQVLEERKIDQHESAMSDISENPQVLEERKIDQHESMMSNVLEKSLNIPERNRKGCKLPKIRRGYTFKYTIENLHSGKPAYSSVDLSPTQNAKNPVKVGNLSHEIHELFSTSCEIQERRSILPSGQVKVSSKHKEQTVEKPFGH